MRPVNVHEAKTHFSKLLARVAGGEEVIIAKGNQPVARLVPLVRSEGDRVPGGDRDRVWIARDFGAPLSAGVIKSFER